MNRPRCRRRRHLNTEWTAVMHSFDARRTFHAEGLFELLEPGGRADENGRVRFEQGLVDGILKADRTEH